MKYFIGFIVIFLAITNTEAVKTYQHKQANIQLQRHNYYRAFHGAPALILDSSITTVAQNYANKLAATGKLQHSGTKTYGENLYWASGSYVNGKATDSWYSEFSAYNYNNPGFSSTTGHFTQVVWKGSKSVGFGFAKGFVVANYFPPGNVSGQFPANVLRKL